MRALLLVFLLSIASSVQANCRHALVLALDVSGSVNDAEYALQVDGLADALASDPIRRLLLNGLPPVKIAVFEWSSQNHQGLIQPWIAVEDDAALERLIARIRAHRKQRVGLKTAIGRALEFSAALMAEVPECWQQTVDISGDGKNNIGPVPRDITAFAAFDRITVNALIVTAPPATPRDATKAAAKARELRRYYEREVIHGPAAFTIEAEGYEDYARAMELKLARELRVPVFGAARP
ncbi:DUF1194 domain-containing protein [Pseudaestuariivita atlantica]|uniref:VWFA domain-containing protein n=1 Tax=Pseudaestuariivita atlantica TaxID=1317121 RepID=A0A0L1JUK1_9RHOB|nr:DUF1194 domain-containing protein [Pseudaestuariivita atlantica]KNG95444.1 hypothetical protein ATO11_02240 [Pseudaestuariivita atlantica]